MAAPQPETQLAQESIQEARLPRFSLLEGLILTGCVACTCTTIRNAQSPLSALFQTLGCSIWGGVVLFIASRTKASALCVLSSWMTLLWSRRTVECVYTVFWERTRSGFPWVESFLALLVASQILVTVCCRHQAKHNLIAVGVLGTIYSLVFCWQLLTVDYRYSTWPAMGLFMVWPCMAFLGVCMELSRQGVLYLLAWSRSGAKRGS